MIRVYRRGAITTIDMQPNRSASWRQTQYLLVAIAMVSLTIAIAWAALGFWIILPFAGLEILLLLYLGYRTCHFTYGRQQLTITNYSLDFTYRLGKRQRRYILSRPQTSVLIFKPRHSLSSDKLVLFQDGFSLPIGEWLNRDDIATLAATLKEHALPCVLQNKVQRVALNPFPPEP
ncbi:hypothetical protein HMF8227_02183 [Saliniradius amylolyticus]|uniref:DUF2244 domain-containing protein n=1 Tax=Saliniradius amylolyticus TaxID=2183582 RepID=A0A2S2E4Q6_9ALTE|nr:DUF2244 domain-containing protein [Saliniradius amylolyticus]AWL12641.1 hypothetical protein HMF8227_02183 [Saliniradius amylolyticus]